VQTYHRLRDIYRSLESGDRPCNRGDINHGFFSSAENGRRSA
jgi:hypothetical protein